LVAYAYNPSYLGGRDQKDHSLKLAWADSSRDLKIYNTKKAHKVVQVVEHLPTKHETLKSSLRTEKGKHSVLMPVCYCRLVDNNIQVSQL
jgi:hypothetical protein